MGKNEQVVFVSSLHSPCQQRSWIVKWELAKTNGLLFLTLQIKCQRLVPYFKSLICCPCYRSVTSCRVTYAMFTVVNSLSMLIIHRFKQKLYNQVIFFSGCDLLLPCYMIHLYWLLIQFQLFRIKIYIISEIFCFSLPCRPICFCHASQCFYAAS